MASSGAALSLLRASTARSLTPSEANAATAAGAVPPEPRTAPRTGAVTSSARAPITPSISVLSARQPFSVCTRVFAEPTSAARSVRSVATASAANLPGLVTESPTHSGPRPATNPGSCSALHSMRS